tara:strand:- start:218 stop:730 length:513 start_codon:yes stop_codon:yes gene_type:complete
MCNKSYSSAHIKRHYKSCKQRQPTNQLPCGEQDLLTQQALKIKQLEKEKHQIEEYYTTQLAFANSQIKLLQDRIEVLGMAAKAAPPKEINCDNIRVTNNFYMLNCDFSPEEIDMKKLISYVLQNIPYEEACKRPILNNVFYTDDSLRERLLVSDLNSKDFNIMGTVSSCS